MLNDDDSLDQDPGWNAGDAPRPEGGRNLEQPGDGGITAHAGWSIDALAGRTDPLATTSRLLVPTSDGSIYLPYEGIVRLQADGSYTQIYTDKGERLMTCKGIGVLHAQLPMEWFHRCHRAHVINLMKVRKLIRIGGHRAELLTGDLVEVSRRNWKKLVQAMGSLRS
jgi:DNA-binding LytR/AlgR family response regulator